MTTTAKAALQAAGIKPKLRLFNKTENGLVTTGPHRVRLIADKEENDTDYRGKDTVFIKILVEEHGEQKTYRTRKFNDRGELSYLVQRLAEIPEGSEIIMTGKKSGVKNVVEITEVKNTQEIDVDDEDVVELPE